MKSKTACLVDHQGLYLPLALKLSESYGRVLYQDPCEKAFPKINEAMIGDGFEGLEKVESFWEHKDEIDFFIFPDSQGSALQLELEDQGYPVWGAFNAEKLEMERELFHDTLGEVGLTVPMYERVIGMDALREHLKDKKDKYIKISKYRGSLETFHWRSWRDDEMMLNVLTVRFGGAKDLIPFLVFDAIETDLEIGADTYCINGDFPDYMMDGFEWKDKGYFGAFKARSEMPKQTQAVLDAFGPVLGKYKHSAFWSMEIRVKGEEFYFIDPTPRGPLPGTGSQMEIYGNLAEIIYEGAMGNIVNPEPAANFSAECVITQKKERGAWTSVEIPKELSQWVKLSGCSFIDGRFWFPPDEDPQEEIGWLVALGDTPTETIEKMLEQEKQLPDGVSANTGSLIDLLKEIHKSEEEGIKFTPMKVPAPSKVVEET
jgi:hypothetical protein